MCIRPKSTFPTTARGRYGPGKSGELSTENATGGEDMISTNYDYYDWRLAIVWVAGVAGTAGNDGHSNCLDVRGWNLGVRHFDRPPQ